MKKIVFILACILMFPILTEARPKAMARAINTYKNCYIYGQSGRNTAKKGSAMCLTTGTTYSMANAFDKAGIKNIDVMLYFGKVKRDKKKVFHLFAPNDPTVTIAWEKDGGTTPFCKFEGPSREPDAYYALKNWKIRNATKLEKVAKVNFDNASGAFIEALPIHNSYIASDIKIGDVILFQLADKPERKGLIKVVSIENDEEKPEQVGNGQYQRVIVHVKIVR
ncbi:MAG: hypothetical protein P4L28_03235 [Paludibacteraceae bacterium]|nr:hypothetical protein [Paludibacteraceae bacterium]